MKMKVPKNPAPQHGSTLHTFPICPVLALAHLPLNSFSIQPSLMQTCMLSQKSGSRLTAYFLIHELSSPQLTENCNLSVVVLSFAVGFLAA
jgi:hypothetical protein